MKHIVNVNRYGAKGGCGLTDTIGIQLALLQAKKGPVTVYIPKGVYHIIYELVIYEHTTLILHDEAVLIRKSPTAMLKNGHRLKNTMATMGTVISILSVEHLMLLDIQIIQITQSCLLVMHAIFKYIM